MMPGFLDSKFSSRPPHHHYRGLAQQREASLSSGILSAAA